jgi:hypothetical protein
MGERVQPRPLCPTSDWEVGRKKALIFLCLSNLSNLSNLFKEFIEKGECPQRIPRDFCQKGRTRWPRWTEPTTTGISHVQPRIGWLDEVRPRLDTKPSSSCASAPAPVQAPSLWDPIGYGFREPTQNSAPRRAHKIVNEPSINSILIFDV